MAIFQSDFVFGLQGNKYQEFLNMVADPIIQKVVGHDNYEMVDYSNHLSFKDFENIENKIFPAFYASFLSDIVKKDDKVVFKTKICISFDQRLCCDTCPNTGRKVTTIKMAGVELVYFILFDIQELFDFIYLERPKDELDFLEQGNVFQERGERENEYDESKLILKIGYVHNINYERGFSFVRLSSNDGIPLYHDRYALLPDLSVGDFVELFFKSGDDKYPVKIKYSLRQDEIVGVVKKFRGKLVYPYNLNGAAFINTNDKVPIYVRPSLAENYYSYNEQIIRCLASKDDADRWKAEILMI